MSLGARDVKYGSWMRSRRTLIIVKAYVIWKLWQDDQCTSMLLMAYGEIGRNLSWHCELYVVVKADPDNVRWLKDDVREVHDKRLYSVQQPVSSSFISLLSYSKRSQLVWDHLHCSSITPGHFRGKITSLSMSLTRFHASILRIHFSQIILGSDSRMILS